MVQSLDCLPLWDTKEAKSICNGSRNRVGETHAEGNLMSIRPFGLFINGRRANFIRPDHENMRKPRVNTPLWYQVLIDPGIDIRCLKLKDSRKDRYSAPVCAKQCGNQLANKPTTSLITMQCLRRTTIRQRLILRVGVLQDLGLWDSHSTHASSDRDLRLQPLGYMPKVAE